MPRDSRAAKHWELMSIIVNQIVFERNGLVPDIKRLNINVYNALRYILYIKHNQWTTFPGRL
jgi:hypothetical protein